jgi:hypothetical protein
MASTEQQIYQCLADIAKKGGVVLLLDTPVPTPDLLLEFLKSVISMEKRKRKKAGPEDELSFHILRPVDSMSSVQ